MKIRKFLITILVMFLAGVCFSAGGTYPIRHRNVANPKLLTRLLQDRIGTLDDEVTALEASQSGIFSNIGTGSVFYCDSGAAADGAGTTWATAVDTLKEAIALCTTLRGDIIYVAPDHAETINAAAALDADAAGITIVGIGSGESQPQISFITNAGADLTISAADVCIYNIRFLGAYSGGVTAGIVITADGDGAMILGCEFRETDNDNELLIMITAATAADELVIMGNRFIGAPAGTDSSAIYLEGASDKTIIQGNHFIGDWSASVIDGLQATSDGIMITDNQIVNLDDGAGKTIQMEASSTGTISGNKCYGNAASFAIAGAAMFVSPDNVAMETENAPHRNYETMLGAFTGDGGSGAGDSVFADIVLLDALLDLIIADFTDYQLDHVAGVTTGVNADGNLEGHVIDKSALSHIMTAGADTSDYLASTMSLEALGADTDTIITAVGTTLPAEHTTLTNAIVAMSDTGYVGTCTTNSSQTTAIVPLLAGFENDAFNTGWSMICTLRSTSPGTAPEGEIIDITDYVSSSGTFTVSENFSVALTDNDRVMVRRTEELELDMPTALGGSETIRYVDSGAAGDATGLTWENASLTLAAAEALSAAGDVIYIAAGHDENEASGDLVVDLANVSIIGLGEGNARPLITCSDDGILMELDAVGITVKNIRLQAGVTACDIGIMVEDGGIGCTLENISFIDGDLSATDEFVIGIVVDAVASNVTIKNCTYYSLDASDHVENFIDLSDTTIDSPSIIGCSIFGDFSEAAIWGDAAAPVNVLIKDNVISNTTTGVAAIVFTGNATGLCTGNRLFADTYGTNGVTTFDPGIMICVDNWAAGTINEQAIRLPISADTSDVAEEDDGSNLERLEYLQNKSDDILAGILMAGGSVGDVFYCDDGGSASGDATTWATAETVLKDAYDKASASVGDIIFVAPAHDESIGAAQIALDTIGVTIIGIGDGADQPQIIMTDLLASVDVSAADNTIKNINFYSTTDEVTITIDVDAAGFIIEDCLFDDDENDFEHTICIDLDGGAEEAEIRRCRFETHSAADGATACINQHTGVVNRLIIEDCSIFGTYSGAAILSTQINTNCLIQNNSITNNSTGVHCIEFTAAATGVCKNNTLIGDKLHAMLDPGSMRCIENYASIGIDSSATLIPPINSTEEGPGQTFYCDSGSAGAGDGKAWNTAVITLDAAINLCSTGRGDTIHVAAGHAESLASATAAAMDLAGVRVIGHGVGAQRPTFTFTTDIGATIAVTAADCTIENMILYSNFATGITAAITASGAADGLVVDNCEFRDAGNNSEMFAHVSLAQACDDATVKNCYFSNTAGSGETLSAVLLVNAIDNCRITNNRFHLDAEDACIKGSTAAGTNVYIADNTFFNIDTEGLAIELNAGTTGIVVRNLAFGNVEDTSPFTVAGCMVAENYGSGGEGESGLIYPAVDN